MRAFAAVLLMGLFGCSKRDNKLPDRYVSEPSFRENLAKQTAMSPQLVAQLRKLGVSDDTKLKLEFFFYTDRDSKAQALTESLRALDYKVESGPSEGDSRLFVVTGWTTQIKMTDGAVVAWTEKMCRLGYDHDCEFDGWGTNPKQ